MSSSLCKLFTICMHFCSKFEFMSLNLWQWKNKCSDDSNWLPQYRHVRLFILCILYRKNLVGKVSSKHQIAYLCEIELPFIASSLLLKDPRISFLLLPLNSRLSIHRFSLDFNLYFINYIGHAQQFQESVGDICID